MKNFVSRQGLYDYDGDSSGGAGAYCLMNNGAHGTNPVNICAYLKAVSGWATVIDLEQNGNISLANLISGPVSDPSYNTFYRFYKNGVTTECFLIENRRKEFRDANALLNSGLAIWHVDELGDHNNQSLLPNNQHLNYEVTLVQADNQWHFENKVNDGDSTDFYFNGNAASAYTGVLDNDSTPNANWWDGSRSGLVISNISVPARTMTCSMKSIAFATLTTNLVTGVTASAATCGGTITQDGGAAITERGVCWGSSPNPTVLTNRASFGTGTGSFTIVLYSLNFNTTYYVRSYAVNKMGTAYGNEITFVTLSPPLEKTPAKPRGLRVH